MKQTMKISKDRRFVKASCECGWSGPVRRAEARSLARYDAEQHEARHASRRTKAQIAADREALLASVGTDWQPVPEDVRASDLKALIASGAIEVEVRENLEARAWLMPGRLMRRFRVMRLAA